MEVVVSNAQLRCGLATQGFGGGGAWGRAGSSCTTHVLAVAAGRLCCQAAGDSIGRCSVVKKERWERSGRSGKDQLVVGLATAAGGDGGGGSGRFGGGGGGDGGDDGTSDEDADVPIPEQSSGILAWYLDLTNRYPVSTKAITAAILNFLGDIFCQLVIDKSEKLDLKRTAVITFLGFILVGPTLHTWYLALSKVVTAGGITGAGIRLVLDQFLFSPAFIALFFTSLLTLEGRPSDIIPKLKQDWKPAVIANWKLWIPFQFVNFLFVPQQLQVAFANVVALAWNVYLSFASHSEVVVAAKGPLPGQSTSVDIVMSSLEQDEDQKE